MDATTRLLSSLVLTKVRGKDKTNVPCAYIVLSTQAQGSTSIINSSYFLLTSLFAVLISSKHLSKVEANQTILSLIPVPLFSYRFHIQIESEGGSGPLCRPCWRDVSWLSCHVLLLHKTTLILQFLHVHSLLFFIRSY